MIPLTWRRRILIIYVERLKKKEKKIILFAVEIDTVIMTLENQHEATFGFKSSNVST